MAFLNIEKHNFFYLYKKQNMCTIRREIKNETVFMKSGYAIQLNQLILMLISYFVLQ